MYLNGETVCLSSRTFTHNQQLTPMILNLFTNMDHSLVISKENDSVLLKNCMFNSKICEHVYSNETHKICDHFNKSVFSLIQPTLMDITCWGTKVYWFVNVTNNK